MMRFIYLLVALSQGLLGCSSISSRSTEGQNSSERTPAAVENFRPQSVIYKFDKDLAPFLTFDLAQVAGAAGISGEFEWTGSQDINVYLFSPAEESAKSYTFRFYDSPTGNSHYSEILTDLMKRSGADFSIVEVETKTRGQIFGGWGQAFFSNFGLSRQPDTYARVKWDVKNEMPGDLTLTHIYNYPGFIDGTKAKRVTEQNRSTCGLRMEIYQDSRRQRVLKMEAFVSSEKAGYSLVEKFFEKSKGRFVSASGHELSMTRDGLQLMNDNDASPRLSVHPTSKDVVIQKLGAEASIVKNRPSSDRSDYYDFVFKPMQTATPVKCTVAGNTSSLADHETKYLRDFLLTE
jgi:hypothetical protein